MPKSTVSKLLPKVPWVPGASRRQQYSAHQAGAGRGRRGLFTEHGYANTRSTHGRGPVTKGALYHFSGSRPFERLRTRRDDASDHQQGAQGQGTREKARAAPRVPRRGPGAALPPDRDPGGAGGARLRAVPRAGGAPTFATVPTSPRSVLAPAWELTGMLQTFARSSVRCRPRGVGRHADDPRRPRTGWRPPSASSSPASLARRLGRVVARHPVATTRRRADYSEGDLPPSAAPARSRCPARSGRRPWSTAWGGPVRPWSTGLRTSRPPWKISAPAGELRLGHRAAGRSRSRVADLTRSTSTVSPTRHRRRRRCSR
jgi:hypothetical protein